MPEYTEAQQLLLDAKIKGLTFSDCVWMFSDPGDRALVAAAEERYEREGEIEIDETSVVSRGTRGAYVMAWVWVPYPEEDV